MTKIVDLEALKAFRQATDKKYAYNDGSYENMTVGNSEQLVSTRFVEDNIAYNFRTAGGGADIGNREYDTIVGGTLVWRQIVQKNVSERTTNGVTVSATNGIYTLNGTATAQQAIVVLGNVSKDHIYLIKCDDWTGAKTSYYGAGWFINNTTNGGIVYRENNLIGTATLGNASFAIMATVGTVFNNLKIKPQIFDLTLMFGKEVCNSVFPLSSDIQKIESYNRFNKLFPKDYYENTGTTVFQSVNVSSHNTVGFNAFNYASGKAKLLGGNEYQITGTYTSVSYENINGDSETLTIDNNGCFTPTNNGVLTVVGGNDTNTCVHLTWSGYRNGDYEPYTKREYPIDSTLTLRGIPKASATKELYFDGDEYHSDGTVIRKYGLGSLSNADINTINTENSIWRLQMKSTWAYFGLIKSYGDAWFTGMPEYVNKHYYNDITNTNLSYSFSGSGEYLIIKNTNWTSASDVQTFFNTTRNFIYELDTPTTEQAAPFTSPQIVDDFGIEEYIDYGVEQGTRDVSIPVGHITKYTQNLRDKLQGLPNLPEETGDYTVHYDKPTRTCTFAVKTSELPTPPSTDGTYKLVCTIADNEAVYTWEADV